jgi:hypothetical protein
VEKRKGTLPERKMKRIFDFTAGILPEMPIERKQAWVLGLDLCLRLWYDGSIWTLARKQKEREEKMQVSPDLLQVLQEQPQAEIAVIVHFDGDPKEYAPEIERLGMSVTRTFRLTHTAAARGLARDVLSLLDQPWVVRIEADQTMRTMT